MNDHDQDTQDRSQFRLVYPTSLEPTLTIERIPYYVLDISESGLRFRNPHRTKMPEDLFNAFLQLHNGEIIKVIGRVLRWEQDQVVMTLARPIPFQKILAEEIFVKQEIQKRKG